MITNKKLIKTAEILAQVFILLFVIQKFGSYALDTYLEFIFKPEEIVELNSSQKIWGTISIIINSITQMGVAIWLWIEAKRRSMNVWIWTILGLVTSLTAAILFYLVLIWKYLNERQ